jgi:hypothetical protein
MQLLRLKQVVGVRRRSPTLHRRRHLPLATAHQLHQVGGDLRLEERHPDPEALVRHLDPEVSVRRRDPEVSVRRRDPDLEASRLPRRRPLNRPEEGSRRRAQRVTAWARPKV